jgi:2,5-diketo-D-gluconate reductase B
MALSLDDHTRVPPIGLGTWQNDDPQQCASTVEQAIEMGYRHIDTAQLYENEEAVGEGIERSSVPREELFVATKVNFKNCSYDDVHDSTRESLRRLGLETIDLLYVHWPAGNYSAEETLPALDELVEEGAVRHIGLSNFTVDLLDEARDVLEHPVYAHQIEAHPHFQQESLREYGRKHDIHTVAYSPFRHGTLFDDSTLSELADREGATVAQLCLAWLIDAGVYPIPKATGRDNLKDNFKACDLSLSDETFREINEMDRGDRYIDPPFSPW